MKVLLIAIIAVDSKVGDLFGIETIYSLGRFVRVITMIIQIFEEKHSDSISQQRLKGLLNLIGPETNFDTEEGLLTSMQNALSDLIDWDAFVFVYFKPVEQKFEAFRVNNKTSLKVYRTRFTNRSFGNLGWESYNVRNSCKD